MSDLNTIIHLRDTAGEDYHKHYCDNCGTCWKHSDTELEKASDEDFDASHECPTCGNVVTLKVMDKEQREKQARALKEVLALFERRNK